jgi:hypothetical protein
MIISSTNTAINSSLTINNISGGDTDFSFNVPIASKIMNSSSIGDGLPFILKFDLNGKPSWIRISNVLESKNLTNNRPFNPFTLSIGNRIKDNIYSLYFGTTFPLSNANLLSFKQFSFNGDTNFDVVLQRELPINLLISNYSTLMYLIKMGTEVIVLTSDPNDDGSGGGGVEFSLKLYGIPQIKVFNLKIRG